MLMTSLLLAVSAVAVMQPSADPLGRAIEYVESGGSAAAVSSKGALGPWQVMPRSTVLPAWALPLLHVPVIGRAEGRRVLGLFHAACRRSGRGLRCALRCYACGYDGKLSDEYCGWYADRVFRRMAEHPASQNAWWAALRSIWRVL